MATRKKGAPMKSRKPVNVVQIACFVTPKQRDSLRELSVRTRITQQSHLREAIDDLIAKYSERPKGPTGAMR